MNTAHALSQIRFQARAGFAGQFVASLGAGVFTLAVLAGLGQIADGYQAEALVAHQAAQAARYAQGGVDADVQRVVITAPRAASRG